MLLLATVLLLLAGGLMVVMVLADSRCGPEGPVGAHLITAPMAVGQALAVGLALGAGSLAATGWHCAVVAGALPGYVVALTVLPILAFGPRNRPLAVAGVLAAVAGCGSVLAGVHSHAAGLAGGAIVAIAGAAGYGLLLALLWQLHGNRLRAAFANAERHDRWRSEQQAWELGEWARMPADAELWQLVQFVHAQHPDVRAQCQARIAALPDLDERMVALLATGWAEHALTYVAREYPRSRQPLAPALAKLLDAELPRWEATLRGAALPHTWSANLAKYVEVVRAVHADGGDLRAQARTWRRMLASVRGLDGLVRALDAA